MTALNKRNTLFLILLDPNLLVGFVGLVAAAGLIVAILLGVTP